MLAALPACQSDLTLPQTVRVSCAEGRRCPAGFSCSPRVGRCLPVDAPDKEPPAVVSASVRVDPAVVGLDADGTVTFQVSEPLAFVPEVTLHSPVPRDLPLLVEEGAVYTFGLRATGAEPEDEAVPLTATLVDRSGNLAADQALGAVPFDFTRPAVRGLRADGADHLGPGATGHVLFELSEAPATLPEAVLTETGAALTCTQEGEDPPAYRCSYAVGEGETDGSYGVTVTARDPAGNLESADFAGVFVLDSTPPAFVFGPEPVNPRARAGMVVGVSFEVDEELGRPATVELRPLPAGEAVVLDAGEQHGQRWVYLAEVSGDALRDGAYRLVVTGHEDLAGNPGETWTSAEPVLVDTVPPALLGPATTREVTDGRRDVFRAGQTVVVDLQVSEDLGDGLPDVVLQTTSPQQLPCEREPGTLPGGGVAYACTLPRPLAGTERPQTLVAVSIDLTDEVGNRGFASTTVTLDFTAPRLVGTSLLVRCDDRLPARVAVNDLWVRAGMDCAAGRPPVQVSFGVSEPTALDAPPRVTVDGRELDCRAGGAGDAYFVFGTSPTGGEVQTDSTDPGAVGRLVQAEVRDRAGNVGQLVLGRLRFDFAAPVLAADEAAQGRLRYVRDPWGSEESGGVPRMRVEIDADAFEERGQVRVWAVTDTATPGEDPEGELYARREVGSDEFVPGRALTVEAGVADHARVHVTLTDRAGNESDQDPGRGGQQALGLASVEWVATLGGKAPGDDAGNPHTLLSGVARAGRGFTLDRWMEEVGDRETFGGAGRVDAETARATTGRAPWIDLAAATRGTGVVLDDERVVWDVRRGRLVQLARDEQGATTWEWDERGWVRRSPVRSPSLRIGYALAYDSTRGRVVLFGGLIDGRPQADTWEWDGADWAEHRPPVAPPARTGGAMTYDPGRRRVVLFGGSGDDGDLGDTWEWDGASWHPHEAPGAPDPGVYLMAHDGQTGRTLLYRGGDGAGSLPDLWAWQGGAWVAVESNGDGCRGGSCSLGEDPGRGLLLFCRHRRDTETLVLRGDRWERRWTSTRPPWTQHVAGLASDPASGLVLLVGSGIWAWDGEEWEKLSPLDPPEARSLAAAAYDEARAEVVVFGGSLGGWAHADTWTGDGAHWTERDVDDAPSSRAAASMAFHAGLGRVVLFGGSRDREKLGDTWVWDGARWEGPEPGEGPSARSHHGMVYDRENDEVVLFGGYSEDRECSLGAGTESCRDTWVWGDGGWEQRAPETTPPGGGGLLLAYDHLRQRTVCVGRSDGARDCGPQRDDWCAATWLWDGDDWELAGPQHVPPEPDDQSMAYDAARGRAVWTAGTDGGTLEWDGADWIRRAPLGGSIDVSFHTLLYDAARRQVLSLGSSWDDGSAPCPRNPDNPCMVPWSYAPQHFVPHLVAAFDLGADRVLEPSLPDRSTKSLRSVSIRVHAGGRGHGPGTGNADGDPVDGLSVSVSAFGHGGWLRLGEVPGASPGAPQEWTGTFDSAWTCGESWCSDGTIGQWQGADGRLHVDVAPLAPHGSSPEDGEIAVDYVELRVRYWRTGCEPPGELDPAGTPEGTPCSDGDPATQGETCQSFECVVP